MSSPFTLQDTVLSASHFKSATVTLSSQKIKALHTTPVEIVPAQGVGKSVIPIIQVVKVNVGSTPYISNGAHFVTGWSPDGYDTNAILLQNFLNGWTHSETNVALMNAVQPQDYPGDISNRALICQFTNALSDGDGTLDVTVLYTVV